MKPPIKTGLLAFGLSGRIFHAPFLDAHDRFELTAVTERTTKEAHLTHPHLTSYDTVDDLINDPTLDLIVINTPNYTHFDYARQALNAGKHLLVEKPFTVTTAQAEQLFTLAEQQNRHILPYQNRRYDSDYLSVKKIIDEGHLGRLVEAHFRFDRYRYTISPKVAKETPVPGSGLLYDLGPHLLDAAISLFGTPLSWTKQLGHFRPQTQVDDYAHLHLTYPQEHQVFLTASSLVPAIQPAFVLHGTQGSYIKHRADVQEQQLLDGILPTDPIYGHEAYHHHGHLTTITPAGHKQTTTIPPIPTSYLHLFDAVYNTIQHNAPFPITPDDILTQLKILES
ncbi:MAG TPA: Gfo/Idh/MocA family oxidoreductase [Anaerolineae bacterium]|nr:Gfo/Idh/MocA family oxidoreductase [Anaerolineae bacterium]